MLSPPGLSTTAWLVGEVDCTKSAARSGVLALVGLSAWDWSGFSSVVKESVGV